MSSIFHQSTDKSAFIFPISFEMIGEKQNIAKAVFDTGCAHSLISADQLIINDSRALKDIKYDEIFNIDVPLARGYGVEAQAKVTKEEKEKFAEKVKEFNDLKRKLKRTGKSKVECAEYLKKILDTNFIEKLVESKNIRFIYPARNYHIDNVYIGNYDLRVSYDTKETTLIGMHVIKDLYTVVFRKNGLNHLFSMVNAPNAEDILAVEIEKMIEMYSLDDTEILAANYINTIIQNSKE